MSQKQLRLNTKMKYWTASYVKDLLYRKSSVHIHQLKQSLIMCDCSSWCACLMWQTNGILPCNSWTPALLKKTTFDSLSMCSGQAPLLPASNSEYFAGHFWNSWGMECLGIFLLPFCVFATPSIFSRSWICLCMPAILHAYIGKGKNNLF